MDKPSVVIHILYHGLPLCLFQTVVPRDWPAWHIWCSREDAALNATACADPEHELHSLLRYKMCGECLARNSEGG